jgi:cell division ATPase FtsA
MLKDCLAVLEIGTSKISLIIGEKSVNGTFAFRAK